MAIVLAMVGILMNFLSIGAYPVWSVIAMSCNALVLWAVTVHSDQFEDLRPPGATNPANWVGDRHPAFPTVNDGMAAA